MDGTTFEGVTENMQQMPAEGVQMDSKGGMQPVFNPSAYMQNHDAVQPVNGAEAMPITNVVDLKRYARGTVVRLSDFADGMPFVVRMRRPSLMALMKAGKIPNQLIVSANELFAKGTGGLDVDNASMLSELLDICETIASAALIEPTYKEIKDAGIELTDEQLMEIFSYTQTGVEALKSFR